MEVTPNADTEEYKAKLRSLQEVLNPIMQKVYGILISLY
jgi:hypothetical protein